MSMTTEQRQAQVSYVPKILRNMAEICEEMGVGEKTVKAWVQKGAPIAVEGDGRKVRYSAEMARLQAWRIIFLCRD
ncbi:MerR family transcriptional regulator [Desulfovibrio intestinalis]|uniref:Transposase n=1 Tax=Desulfovibrio intestinalis TaxID=58621 RepID=A0A7W8C3T8_9BACT|nr:MerR family transcriptional regulator [Desulfovibrio intestinalis]MBB5143937.1 transposase [Desulfovibrio intestinalis]